MTSPASVKSNIAELARRIRSAEKLYGRDANSVTLMAVSKTRPAGAIRAAAEAGITDIGENYITEALQKQPELTDLSLTWHCIGPLQSNKTRDAATHFDWVHSVDRAKIARRLNDQRPEGLAPLNICLQVNIDQEGQKAGVAPQDLPALAAQVADLPHLRLRGLMAIPAPREEFDDQRAVFATIREIFDRLRGDHPSMDALSMGMSRDFEAAIAEGATMVRIGTEIFGERNHR